MEERRQLLMDYDNLVIDYQKNYSSTFSKEDLFEYNEVLFSAHYCAIEGNTFSVNETRELKEHGLKLKLKNKSMLEAFEILDHFKAFEFLFNDLNKPFSEELLTETHRILTANTILYTKGYNPGEYTKTRMAAGDTIFPDHQQSIKSVPQLMEQTQKVLDDAKVHPIEISAKFHYFFIYLHPFPDGNGRIGRLFSNYILAKKEQPLLIIKKEQREQYIESLKLTHKHNNPDLISMFFIKTSMERMKSEIEEMNQKITQTRERTKGTGLSFIF